MFDRLTGIVNLFAKLGSGCWGNESIQFTINTAITVQYSLLITSGNVTNNSPWYFRCS